MIRAAAAPAEHAGARAGPDSGRMQRGARGTQGARDARGSHALEHQRGLAGAQLALEADDQHGDQECQQRADRVQRQRQPLVRRVQRVEGPGAPPVDRPVGARVRASCCAGKAAGMDQRPHDLLRLPVSQRAQRCNQRCSAVEQSTRNASSAVGSATGRARACSRRRERAGPGGRAGGCSRRAGRCQPQSGARSRTRARYRCPPGSPGSASRSASARSARRCPASGPARPRLRPRPERAAPCARAPRSGLRGRGSTRPTAGGRAPSVAQHAGPRRSHARSPKASRTGRALSGARYTAGHQAARSSWVGTLYPVAYTRPGGRTASTRCSSM